MPISNSGVTFKSSPIAKLFLLGSIKFAMRDAWGMGIEYEGGRPGWMDSMNGLPGMVGSGMPETYEMLLLTLMSQLPLTVALAHTLLIPSAHAALFIPS